MRFGSAEVRTGKEAARHYDGIGPGRADHVDRARRPATVAIAAMVS
ncbi:MAG: hypothetical protein MZU84_07245 [Sphingobacterium sp.]|nr:hypothetical protein [Sphingobacterium sp.]